MDDQNNLAVNKTVVFYSPLEAEEVTVRTGTLDDISFLHSILHSYSHEYSHIENVERQTLVDKVYKQILHLYEQEVIEGSRDKVLKHVLDTVIKVLSEKTEEVYEILSELISVERLTVLFQAENPFQAVVDEVTSQLKTFEVEEERINFCVQKITELLENSRKEAENIIRPRSLPLNRRIVNIMADYLNRDIYCLHSQTRLPIYDRSSDYKKRKTVILLQVSQEKKGYKYEIVGKLLPGNRVQREFPHRDPFVKRIRVFLYEPVRFAEDYPDLADYLPTSVYKKSPEYNSSPNHSPYRERE